MFKTGRPGQKITNELITVGKFWLSSFSNGENWKKILCLYNFKDWMLRRRNAKNIKPRFILFWCKIDSQMLSNMFIDLNTYIIIVRI